MEHIFSKKTLREFWEKHADAGQHLKTWYEMAKNSNLKTPHDRKRTYAAASVVKKNERCLTSKATLTD